MTAGAVRPIVPPPRQETGHNAPVAPVAPDPPERLSMATLHRFQIPGSQSARLQRVVRLALLLGMTLALATTTACKKSGAPADAGHKPPVVKAKKPGADAKAEGPVAADVDAKSAAVPAPGVVSQRAPAPHPAGAPEAATPAAAPAPMPAALPVAAAPSPVVPVPAGRGKAPEVAAKIEPAKPEPTKLEAARVEPAKPMQPIKPEEQPLPPGAVAVRAVATEAPLDVNGYIIAADLPKVLGTKQKFHRTELVGVNPSPNYNAMFYATDKQDLFGVSVQVWRDPNLAESRTRFNTMKNSYSNVSPTNKITDMGFRSFYDNVVTLVFVDPRRPLLAAVSCSTKVCGGDQMIELARRVAERLH